MRSGLFLLIVLALVSIASAAHVTLKWDEPSYLHTRIFVGDTVTWITSDDKPHTITSTDNTNELDSEVITNYPSKTFSHTFNKPGNFHYTSKFNSTDMLGTIVVTPSILQSSFPLEIQANDYITESDLSGGVTSISGLFLAAVSAALLVFVIS